MTIIFYFTTIAFVAICLFMILLVLVQKGRGGGLASAFGGMGGGTAFGAKTGDVLTWTTAIVFGIFVVLAVVLNYVAEEVANPAPAQAGGAANVGAAAAGAGALDTGPSAPVETPTTVPTTQAVGELLSTMPTTAPATTQP